MPKNSFLSSKKSQETHILIRHSVPIAHLTTFQNQGCVQEVIQFSSLDLLKEFICSKKTYYILGKGSNTLINPDTDIPTFIQIAPDMFPIVTENAHLRVCAGISVHKLMTLLQENGLSGLEFAAGVPASVGGMVAMNFGCWGQEIADFIVKVHLLDEQGRDFWLEKNQLQFAYRSSIFQHKPWIILEAIFACSPLDPATIKETILKNIQTRIDKQPLKAKTFGSTFKNPPGNFAAALLEKNGFKNKEINGVKFSSKHANFMVNCGHATFQECFQLIQDAIQTVEKNDHIRLEPEVKLIL